MITSRPATSTLIVLSVVPMIWTSLWCSKVYTRTAS